MGSFILVTLFAMVYILPGLGQCSEKQADVDNALMSAYAVNMDTGDVLIDKNCDLSLIPASCMKIVTTAAALQILGEDYRFETHLEFDGYVDRFKTLHGNLYIRGGGDPCLGSDRTPGSLSWEKQIDSWVDAVQKFGIQSIEGKVIGDASLWEKAMAVPSWSWEDLGNYYGAGACALSFHENSYSLFFRPGERLGEPTTILRTDPQLLTVAIQNEVKTGPEGSGDQACVYGSEFSTTQIIRGTIPAAVNEFTIQGAIPDPAKLCADLLVKKLHERGIPTREKDLQDVKKRTIIHTVSSPPVKEIVYWTNQKSINLYAEHLLKKMGEVMYNDGSTRSGIKAVTKFWESEGISLAGFNMADGSGLSRKNLVTAKQMVSMLLKVKKANFFPVFFESLPQKEGSIRAKSGSMSQIRGYVGYADKIAFAILVNHCPDQKMMSKKANDFLSDLNPSK